MEKCSPQQLPLDLKTRGRPKKKGDIHKTSSGKIAHISRPSIDRNNPIHINIRVQEKLPNLRRKSSFKLFTKAVKRARLKGLRVVHFSLQTNHLHLLVEADSNRQLSSGMRSLLITYSIWINRLLKRQGPLFRDRFNMEVITTPRRMKNLLNYIFKNSAKHRKHAFNQIDLYCSHLILSAQDQFRLFGRKIPPPPISHQVRALALKRLAELLFPPQSWLAAVGWQT
ncbi:MAG: hypothetical protein HN353_10355 [Bdellovibrionales bacterium]|jgi:REP element-mobilizing transposase RayT|nr:hypothetical protein [Bdellovibrionales bacterium]MBT3524816.1 hypothetical protein [Bdellovibrionales bacterium]MBT7668972.1 hypothetical protein [Bdellovibrionales bacterium]